MPAQPPWNVPKSCRLSVRASWESNGSRGAPGVTAAPQPGAFLHPGLTQAGKPWERSLGRANPTSELPTASPHPTPPPAPAFREAEQRWSRLRAALAVPSAREEPGGGSQTQTGEPRDFPALLQSPPGPIIENKEQGNTPDTGKLQIQEIWVGIRVWRPSACPQHRRDVSPIPLGS